MVDKLALLEKQTAQVCLKQIEFTEVTCAYAHVVPPLYQLWSSRGDGTESKSLWMPVIDLNKREMIASRLEHKEKGTQ